MKFSSVGSSTGRPEQRGAIPTGWAAVCPNTVVGVLVERLGQAQTPAPDHGNSWLGHSLSAFRHPANSGSEFFGGCSTAGWFNRISEGRPGRHMMGRSSRRAGATDSLETIAGVRTS